MNLEITTNYLDALEKLLFDAQDIVMSSDILQLDEDAVNFNMIDKYVAALNKYYYQSFHEHFFPDYKKAIVTEIEELLHIKNNQDIIAKDIQANIKRYAKLYNQVKVVNHLLKDTREDFNNLLYSVYRDKEHQSMELLYALKSLTYALNELKSLSGVLTILYEDKVLLDAIKFYPNMPRILVNIFKKSTADLDVIRRLIIRLKAILNLIKQLENKDISSKIVEGIINDFKIQIDLVYNDKLWSTLPRPFVIDFNFKVQTFIELISAYNELNKLHKIRQTALDYENLVFDFIVVLDKGLDFLENHSSKASQELLENSFTISKLSHSSLVRLNQYTFEATKSLEHFQNEILKAGEPDFAYLAKTVAKFLEDYQGLFLKLLELEDLMQIVPLVKQLKLVSLEFLDLDRYLHAMTDKYGFSELIEKKYLNLINILDSYISFTNNTRGDLERIMAPRNLSRVWKSFNVKVERLPLEVGKKMPVIYEEILSATNITRKLSSLDTDTIIHEEGDIFIIIVDDNLTYEIPPLILAEKG